MPKITNKVEHLTGKDSPNSIMTKIIQDYQEKLEKLDILVNRIIEKTNDLKNIRIPFPESKLPNENSVVSALVVFNARLDNKCEVLEIIADHFDETI